MNCFGPHQHSIIDFRKLDESPIFLIGGDTGAGKSTIFDAMTYALFNKTTSDRDAREMRSQFATGDEPTKVIFYFEQNGKIFKVERTPEQFLTKKSGKGLTKKNPTANLSVVEDVHKSEIDSIATKPVDVGYAIDDILNLNAEQFKKIILLPQNDFSEFLKSNTNDKEKILKKIFGTQLFTDFTAKLKDHYDQAKSKADDFNNDIKAQIQASIWNETEQDQLKKIPNDQLIPTINSYVAARQEKLTVAQNNQKNADTAWKKADNNYQAAKELQNKFEQLASSKKDYQKHIIEHSTDMETKKKHVIQLEWAQPLQETVHDLNRLQQEQQFDLKNKQELDKELQQSKDQLTVAKKEIATLNDQADDFEDKKKRAQNLSILITKVQDIESIKTSLTQLEPKLKVATEAVHDKANDLKAIKNSIDSKNTELSKYQDLSTQKDQLIKAQTNFSDTFSKLESNRNNSANDVAEIQSKLDKLNSALKEKTQDLAAKKADYQEKIKTRQSLMIAQLRQELSIGEPCPVCGSTKHPYAQNKATADETKLRQAMDAVDASQKAFASAETDLKNLQSNINENSDDFEQKQQLAVSAQVDLSMQYSKFITTSMIDLPQEFNFKNAKLAFQTQVDQLDHQIQVSQKLTSEIKDLQKQQSQKQADLNLAQSKLDQLTAEIKTRSTDLQTKSKDISNPNATSQELISQKDELNKAIEAYQNDLKVSQETLHKNELSFNNNQTKLTDIQSQLDKISKDINNFNSELTTAIQAKSAQTNNLDILKNWINELSQNKLVDLKNAISSYEKEKEILTININKIKEQLKDTQQPDLENLKQILSDAETKRTLAIENTTSTNRDFTEAQTCLEKLQEIIKHQGDFAQKLAAITSLYNVVNGKDGNDNKLKLETYVVQNYLLKILDYANNKFLNRLSHNRYSFELSTQSTNKQRDHGLDINIYDRETNSTRSSDTLSGGETFIAALSIALSLSEVVQSSANGVQIDALFVDEGFGSLDDETLGEAMAALEDIGQNRMVGIISHIESMKQSIGQQLLVKKLGDGKSKIVLVDK